MRDAASRWDLNAKGNGTHTREGVELPFQGPNHMAAIKRILIAVSGDTTHDNSGESH